MAGTRQEKKIEEGAGRFLDGGEKVLAAIVARPRGWTQAAAGSARRGFAHQGRNPAAAGQAELGLASPMALAITQRRLITFRIGSPIGFGIGGAVKELVSAVPLAAVDSIEVRRLLLGQVLTVNVRGRAITLEANPLAGCRALAETLERVR
jgi:hypothetical protein